MRIRSTKPEFWRSERIASVPWEARLVLKGLESYVDDNGVGKDDLALIVADVFPRDLSRNPTGTLQKVSEAISALEIAGLIWRYEANGTRLLFISFWESIQRIEKPSKGRSPRPDGSLDYRASEIRESSPTIPGGLPEPSGLEQGNRGTGEQVEHPRSKAPDRLTSTDEKFDEFWSTYPKKVSKVDARKRWNTLMKSGADPDQIIAGAQLYAKQSAGKERQHVKNPDGWLNGGRWADEDLQRPTTPSRPSTPWAGS